MEFEPQSIYIKFFIHLRVTLKVMNCTNIMEFFHNVKVTVKIMVTKRNSFLLCGILRKSRLPKSYIYHKKNKKITLIAQCISREVVMKITFSASHNKLLSPKAEKLLLTPQLLPPIWQSDFVIYWVPKLGLGYKVNLSKE